MAKNTPKLTAEQRDERKLLKKALAARGGAMFTYPERGIVVVVVPALPNRLDSKYVHFAVAQCSESDNFRAKVGQHMALERWFNDQTMSRVSADYLDGPGLESIAGEIAEFFALE